MRLIDADKFMDILITCEQVNRQRPLPEEKLNDKAVNNYETGQKETFDLIIEHLEKQPTAYNLDKVMEKLAEKIDPNVDMDTGQACDNWVIDIQNEVIRECMEIVREGSN